MYINYYESRKKAELKELIGKTLISATASLVSKREIEGALLGAAE